MDAQNLQNQWRSINSVKSTLIHVPDIIIQELFKLQRAGSSQPYPD